MKRWIVGVLVLALLFAGAGCTKPETNVTTEPIETDIPGEFIVQDENLHTDFVCDDNYRVFYEIFVSSFSDADGDGIGDIRGIINRMDYLNDGDPNSGRSLGVEGIWLTPIFQSPSYHKYDVTDYYTVDPDFGTEEDLKELVDLCHERNVKVILDLPINHTSVENQWFKDFVSAHKSEDTGSEFYDFYSYYTDGESAPAGRAFHKASGTNVYYECNFWDQMPELEFDNDYVRETVLDVAKHYLDLGIDGFRFDAAKYLYFGEIEQNVNFWEWYIAELKKINPDVYTVAEVWDSDGITDAYYPALNCFNFTTSQSSGLIAATAKSGNVNQYTGYVDEYLDTVVKLREDAMLVSFIANHDTDRAAGYLTSASGQMQMAANIYLLGPGSPFIYYGEELGMRGSRGGSNTDANRRLAMVWGDGDTVKNPEGADYSSGSQIQETAADQMVDADSLYTYYKELLMIRKANPEIARGDYTALTFESTKLGGFVSTWNGNSVCVLHNTTDSAVTVDLSKVTDLNFNSVAAMIGQGSATLNGTSLTLDAQTSVVLR